MIVTFLLIFLIASVKEFPMPATTREIMTKIKEKSSCEIKTKMTKRKVDEFRTDNPPESH